MRPGWSIIGSADSDTLSASGTITLQNTQGTSRRGAAAAGTGTLRLDAREHRAERRRARGERLRHGGARGSQRSRDRRPTAASALSTSGALSVTASQITTGADVDLTLTAGGAVSLLAPAKPLALDGGGLGGSLSVTGSTIDVATASRCPPGGST